VRNLATWTLMEREGSSSGFVEILLAWADLVTDYDWMEIGGYQVKWAVASAD